MKIALVTETYPPEVNGVARTLNMLVTGLAERGHKVMVIRPRQFRGDASCSRGGGISEMIVPGVPLPRYQGLHMGLPSKRRLVNCWRSDRPDVVHVATEGPLGLTAVWAARKLNIPVMSSFHTNFHQYGRHYGYGFLYKVVVSYLRYVHNQTACTMVPSEDVREALIRDGFKNVEIMSRGVDTDLFSPEKRSTELREQWGVTDDALVICYVGRVADEKNIPLAVEAYERMRETDGDIRLVIVGDGPLRPVLERQHPEYIFAGMRHGEDLASHYASADIFIFPSITETFGNVVSEAMSCGLAVLAYDYAAPRQLIVTGRNGVKVPFDDRPAFLLAASDLIRDKGALSRMKSSARETALSLSWDKVVSDYLEVLSVVVGSYHDQG